MFEKFINFIKSFFNKKEKQIEEKTTDLYKFEPMDYGEPNENYTDRTG